MLNDTAKVGGKNPSIAEMIKHLIFKRSSLTLENLLLLSLLENGISI